VLLDISLPQELELLKGLGITFSENARRIDECSLLEEFGRLRITLFCI